VREEEASERVLARLEQDGLVRRHDGVVRTTRRWQGAMARAALRLVDAKEVREDIRIPMAMALLELYDGVDDRELIKMIEVLLPLEVVAARTVQNAE
jgi:hypothetical protein